MRGRGRVPRGFRRGLCTLRAGFVGLWRGCAGSGGVDRRERRVMVGPGRSL